MITQTIDKVINELKDFPNDKIPSLLDYMHYLKRKKKKSVVKTPNAETLQTFKDTDEGKNLNHYDTVDDFFSKIKEKNV